MSRKPKMKWTEQMNKDILECKRKAKELTSSQNPPCNRNGRRKGYIEVMKELWDEKGYAHLELKSQNLRDQASRLEKLQGGVMDDYGEDARAVNADGGDQSALSAAADFDYSQESFGDEDQNTRENANFTTQSHSDLHITTTQSPADIRPVAGRVVQSHGENLLQDHIEVPGLLPSHEITSKPSCVHWGRRSDGVEMMLNTSSIDTAYNEITTWRKNTFLVPYGKTGRDFIEQLTKHINDWNKKTEMQHIALKAAIVLLALGLQKPSRQSKAKDHQECLSRRLTLWKEGEIDTLLREGRMIQKRITV